MALTLSGQRPAVLDPTYVSGVAGNYDPIEELRTNFVEPLFQPFGANPVSVLDALYLIPPLLVCKKM